MHLYIQSHFATGVEIPSNKGTCPWVSETVTIEGEKGLFLASESTKFFAKKLMKLKEKTQLFEFCISKNCEPFYFFLQQILGSGSIFAW